AAFREWELTPAETLAVVIFLLFPLISLPLQQLVLPSKGTEITRSLQPFEPAPNRKFFFVGSPTDANEVHLCSKGNIQIVAKSGAELPPATAGTVVVFPERDMAAVVTKGYHPGMPVAEEFHPRSISGFLRALLHGELPKYREQNSREFFVATPQ
ncbi:MAG TPA: hypothetical protein VKA67_07340, partial [Verrucomicrobiae bacterium]|nr:hypothetical protein [Verrucomicrobiae bacterium]